MKIRIEHNGKRLPRKLKKSIRSRLVKQFKDCGIYESTYILLVVHPPGSVIHNGIVERIEDHRSTKTTEHEKEQD